jgi:hypothetical protein
MHCSGCGKPLLEDNRFCSFCGRPVSPFELAEQGNDHVGFSETPPTQIGDIDLKFLPASGSMASHSKLRGFAVSFCLCDRDMCRTRSDGEAEIVVDSPNTPGKAHQIFKYHIKKEDFHKNKITYEDPYRMQKEIFGFLMTQETAKIDSYEGGTVEITFTTLDGQIIHGKKTFRSPLENFR